MSPPPIAASAAKTEVACVVEDLGGGAGRTTCFECRGTGDWTPFHPAGEPAPCVECKGAGWVLICI